LCFRCDLRYVGVQVLLILAQQNASGSTLSFSCLK
jgi:hypothetical protein